MPLPPNPGVARLTQRTFLQFFLPAGPALPRGPAVSRVDVAVVARGVPRVVRAWLSSQRSALAWPSRSSLRRYSALCRDHAAWRSAVVSGRSGADLAGSPRGCACASVPRDAHANVLATNANIRAFIIPKTSSCTVQQGLVGLPGAQPCRPDHADLSINTVKVRAGAAKNGVGFTFWHTGGGWTARRAPHGRPAALACRPSGSRGKE